MALPYPTVSANKKGPEGGLFSRTSNPRPTYAAARLVRCPTIRIVLDMAPYLFASPGKVNGASPSPDAVTPAKAGGPDS
jgi:hypothetical protein